MSHRRQIAAKRRIRRYSLLGIPLLCLPGMAFGLNLIGIGVALRHPFLMAVGGVFMLICAFGAWQFWRAFRRACWYLRLHADEVRALDASRRDKRRRDRASERAVW